MTPLERAIQAKVSAAALADAIDVSPSTPGMWKSRKSVPAEHCAAIERATDCEVTREELRPKDWARIWPELAGIKRKSKRAAKAAQP